jgi:ferredoxin-NADP reductase
MPSRRGAQLHYLLGSRAKLGYDPLDARRLRALVPDLAAHDVYLCGPDAMTEAAERSLRAAGVPRSRIHAESFQL